MQVNKNGIAVYKPKQTPRRQPLEYALDEVTYYRREYGQIITIVVPKFSHLHRALKQDGWKREKIK